MKKLKGVLGPIRIVDRVRHPLPLIATAGIVLLIFLGGAKSLANISDYNPTRASSEKINPIEERNFWSSRIDRVGVEKAYQEFKDAYSSKHFGVQHYVSHIVGELLYEKSGIKGLSTCDASFAFGCYHSFFGRAIAERSLGVIPELDKACVDKYGPYGTGCLHGIGHGLLEYLGHDRLLDALNACLMTTQKNPLFGCTSGVFMEYNVPIIISTDTAYTKFRELDQNQPYFPCTDIPDHFRNSCYYEMPQWWDKVYGHDFKKLGLLCADLKHEEHQESCYLGIGNIVAPSSNYQVADAVEKCAQMPNRQREIVCRSGTSWSFYAEPKYRSLATQVCDGLSDGEREQCVSDADLIGKNENAEVR